MPSFVTMAHTIAQVAEHEQVSAETTDQKVEGRGFESLRARFQKWPLTCSFIPIE